MQTLTYGSVCSGIEAASMAWEPLGWRPAWFAEIEPFPCAVLAHHWPHVPNLGDMTGIADRIRAGEIEAPDILVGGTPCQAFSVAGARAGLADPRGQLTLAYVDLANAIDSARAFRGKQPAVTVWENVPGVLSSKDNAFGCFLGALAGESCELQPPGGGWADAGCVFGPQRAIAWRVCDAQHFGVAQRRRRVFVVASARDGFDPAAVLFEFEGVRRDTAPRREAGQDVAGTLASRADGGGFPGTDEACSGYVQPVAFANAGHFGGMREVSVSDPLRAKGSDTGNGGESLIACLAHGQGGAEIRTDGGAPCLTCNHEAPIVVHGTQDPCVMHDQAFALGRNNGGESHANAGGQVAVCITGEITHTLKAEGFDASEDGTGRGQPIVAVFAENSRAELRYEGGDGSITGALKVGGGKPGQPYPVAQVGSAVRHLTPLECERLQGFPDGHTAVPHRGKPAADGPRYKALGNSMCVLNMRWIGRRIQGSLCQPAAPDGR